MVSNLIKLIRTADKLKKPRTRQDVREDARKPKGAPSAHWANWGKNIEKFNKKPKKGLAGFKSKLSKPNPLSAGGGKTYIVNGKLVTKEAFLKAKGRHDRRPQGLRSKLKGARKKQPTGRLLKDSIKRTRRKK